MAGRGGLLEVEVNEEQRRRVIARLAQAARPATPVVVHFRDALEASIHTQFKLGGNPAWVPNSRNTVAAKGHSKPLFGASRGKSGIEAGLQVPLAGTWPKQSIAVTAPFPGTLMQKGRTGPWEIRSRGPWPLRFLAAESQASFVSRRRRSQAARRAGKAVKVPSRPGPIVVHADVVHHPGYPARPFIPEGAVLAKLVQDHWRTPLGAFLFHGVTP